MRYTKQFQGFLDSFDTWMNAPAALGGSPKQIEWATDIRWKKFTELKGLVDTNFEKAKTDVEQKNARIWFLNGVCFKFQKISSIEDASWWIARRELPIMKILTDPNRTDNTEKE